MAFRSSVRSAGLAFLVLAGVLATRTPVAVAGPCDLPLINPIVCENSLPGSPASQWDITGNGDPTIQGFATDISVPLGGTVNFKIDTDASAYHIDLYRLGYYGGLGARKVATVLPSAALPQIQPDPVTDTATGLVDAGNWSVSASWTVPATAVSGVYVAKVIRDDTSGASHIVFVVRDDARSSAILFKTSDATWQAYNSWGGNSLYVGAATSPPASRAHKVSYNRPFDTRGNSPEDWLFNAEYPMIRWLEANGYDVAYSTDVDADRNGGLLLSHEAVLSVGHDEYWSAGARANFEAARDAGVHLAFFSGNEIYWKVRWENSVDGANTPFRTLVCYKEGTEGESTCGTKCDPLASVWTGLWRSGCAYPGADGCRPENALSGNLSWTGSTGSVEVPSDFSGLRFWRNTAVAGLTSGSLPLATNSLGYEWDHEQSSTSYPAGRVRLSRTVLGGRTHHLSLYRHAGGALVFGAGTVQWSWGLDGTHDRGASTPSVDMQQATVNLLAEMGAQPGTLQPGLVAATATGDVTPPNSAIDVPLAGAALPAGASAYVSGSALDPAGVVAGVEVSVDGGATWTPAIGTSEWTFRWTPAVPGPLTLQVRAFDDWGNLQTSPATVAVTIVAPAAATFPTSLWPATQAAGAQDTDPGAIEVGVRFRSDVPGVVTGARFYKHAGNIGVHVGHLWTGDGTPLATATFTGETYSGWQQVSFSPPVVIGANIPYVVSVYMPNGRYASTPEYFRTSGVDHPPLHAHRDSAGQSNGVFTYGTGGGFPDQSHASSNYWVDVVFDTALTPDTTPPTVVSTAPANGASGVSFSAMLTATFDETLSAASVNDSTVELRDAANALVPATVSLGANPRTIVVDPASLLAVSTTYTVTLRGGAAPSVRDVSGNPLAASFSWSFTTAGPPPPPPSEGPGGPVLVIASAANPFSRYYAEILRAEGLNAFTVTDLSQVDAAVLAAHDVVILGEMPLSAAQVTMLSNWVQAGGNLIAMRPDGALAGLLGLTPVAGALSDRYLLLDTARPPAAGLVGETIQFHGTADLYTPGAATVVATLYSSATLATSHPAVTIRNVGSSGGQAAAFTYDLARSIVLTRQGNPAWAGQERDGIAPKRSDDLFFGAAIGDPQPDWVDLDKVAIPQADEQQRLLANLILLLNQDRKPLPRFWYFPRGLKAAVVMTGDNHSASGMSSRFEIYRAQSPADCSAEDWECVRATGYLYSGPEFTDAQAAFYESLGFEVAVHVSTQCADWTPETLPGFYDEDLATFAATYPSVPAPTTNRTHCIAWSDWATQAKVESERGIRFDTNYYYWPGPWVQERPGMFTGSGMPMRFADLDGTLIDCYQAATQMTDESGQTYPYTSDVLLDRALGPQGYYGAFVANIHFDSSPHPSSDAIVGSAISRGIPVVSARQMLQWVDGRNGSTFGSIAWNAGTLTFTVTAGAGANQLRGMLPLAVPAGELASLTRDGSPVTWTVETIKGFTYAFFPAATGAFVATYVKDHATPLISGVVATPGPDGTSVTITWTTNEPADTGVQFGIQADPLVVLPTLPAYETSHTRSITGLSPGRTYYFRVLSNDAAGNLGVWPPVAVAPATFATLPLPCAADDRTTDFAAGTLGAGASVSSSEGGELMLAPAVGSDLDGPGAPLGWSTEPWSGGGGTAFVNGCARVDGAVFGPTATFGPGSTLEFVATFAPEAFQHVGFTDGFASTWMLFSTGSTTTTLYARTNPGSETAIPGFWFGSPHRFRIQRTATAVIYSIDGNVVATHPFTATTMLRPLVSDFNTGGSVVDLAWMRLLPYSTAGSFTSRVFDAGESVDWTEASWNASTPAGTSLSIWVRRGETPEPDGTWTPFVALASPGAPIGGSSRYLQYRADLQTSDALVTPTLQNVAFRCAGGPSLRITAAAGVGGSIFPSGEVGVSAGGEQTFTIVPDGGNHVVDVLVDGVSVGAVTTYTFSGVTANHTIEVSFAPPAPLAVDGGLPVEFGLSPAYPNPATDRTRLSFAVPTTAWVRVFVLDVQGREVEELARGEYSPGRYELTWRPKRHAGAGGPGIYFVRFEGGGRAFTRRVAVTF